MRVTHRPGYFAPEPWSNVDTASKRLSTAELVAGAREGGTLGVELVALPVSTGTTDAVEPILPYLVRIEGEPLLESHYGERLDVELHLYAFDDAGRIAGFHNQTLALDLSASKERLVRGGILFYDAMTLPAGRYRLRVVARNNLAWTWGVHTAWLTVPDLDTLPVTPMPSPSLEPAVDWIVARGEGAANVPYPYEVDGAIWMPMAGGLSLEKTTIGANRAAPGALR